MDMTIRAMKPDERNYSYTQEKKMQPVYADVDELGQEKNQAFVARSHPGLVDLFLRETRRAKEANLEKNTPALAKCKREKER